jgi:hypothetical protein
MRILFVLNRMAHVRHFDRAVRLLADRGHEVLLASQDGDIALEGVLAGHARVRAVSAPRSRKDQWAGQAKLLRRARDYMRFLHPRYASARQLRARAFRKLAVAVSTRSREMGPEWSDALLTLNERERTRLDTLLAQLATAIPVDPGSRDFVASCEPDAVILSPMVGVGFSQADFVRGARELGIPTGMLVFSWDNLSNKGLIHEAPDRMLVWNELQRREAAELHQYPVERVTVTGAPRFDELFEMQPATTREQLCELAGLEPGRPIVAYLCSSKFVSARERAFVERWIAALRRSVHPALAECSLIVRPHPAGQKDWHAEEKRVVRWPGVHTDKAATSRPFADPHTVVMTSQMQNADRVLHDTVFHSAAVVGLNTSAEIEAAIVGRPVYTVIDADAGGQEGTLHFHYLLREHGGPVERAAGFDVHCGQLADGLAGRYDRDAIKAFVHAFVRPHGLDRAVAPIVANAIEELARHRSQSG